MANSGQTDEILRLIPFMQRNGNRIIAMTGNPESTLAKNAHYHLNVNVTREACPMNLAPTSSTTAMLVMGDALAIRAVAEGRVNLKGVVSHVFGFDELQRAMDLSVSDKERIVKAVVKIG